MCFAYGQAANGEAVEGELSHPCDALFSKLAMTGALDNAKQRLGRFASGPKRPFGPAMGEIHRRFGLIIGSRGLDTLIESHHHVAADRFLHFHAWFRREEIGFSIHVALKTRAFLIHFSGVRQGKDLKSAGVGKHRAIPMNEAMDAAEALEDFNARTKKQVIGIRQKDARSRGL